MHDALIHALAKVDRPGDICVAGDLPLTMPGLEIEGLGTLRLPLGRTQAGKLIRRCRQAPYGKGTRTLVDTTVRRVWELDSGSVRFTNAKWEALIESLIGEVQRGLGLGGRKLTAHLYKLLVYEKGSFFLPHRDGEKLDRMVATLVVALPSPHTGGELLVSHNGRQHEISFAGAASGHELSYAAFYADCEHEVRPLESGYRLCLTYNVTLATSRGRKGITAPSYGAVVEELARLFDAWRHGQESQKLAVTLDHHYTQGGLTLDSLKGVDRSRAEVLFEAAERAECVAHLALITLWQSGTAEGDYDDYSSGWHRSYHWDSDDDVQEEDYASGGSEYEMGEIFDSSLSADHWSDRQGRRMGFGQIPLLASEIVADAEIDTGDPTEEEFEGYTGNAGMTLERWYHRAAVVVWPRDAHFAVLSGAGTDAAIAGLEPLVKRLGRSSKSAREALQRECRDFAATIIERWRPSIVRQPWEESKKVDRGGFPELLYALDDPELVRRFLTRVLAADGGMRLDSAFPKFCKKHGWSAFEAELGSVIEATTAETLVRNARVVRLLCRQRDSNAERLALCARLCGDLAGTVVRLDTQPSPEPWRDRQIDRAALLVESVDAMLAIAPDAPLLSLIDHALDHRGKYELTATHLTAIFALEPRLHKLAEPIDAISHWLAACRQVLEARTARPPAKPTDYRRAHELSCSCGDCRQLSRFLADPKEREARFPLAQERRRHLHEIIERNGCDVTHVTERRGRPFTLVCTKTTASFQHAGKIYARDRENLSRLIRLEERMAGQA